MTDARTIERRLNSEALKRLRALASSSIVGRDISALLAAYDARTTLLRSIRKAFTEVIGASDQHPVIVRIDQELSL